MADWPQRWRGEEAATQLEYLVMLLLLVAALAAAAVLLWSRVT